MKEHLCRPLPEYSFDFDQIKKEVEIIYQENGCIPQIGLTHSEKDLTEEEKILESVGSIYDRETKTYKFKETDFTVFNERYKSFYLYEMYKSIPNLGRFRIMTMQGPKCYTIHQDLSMRYHYVLETNKNCLFLFPGLSEQFHIPCNGKLYIVDTRYAHTFVNGSNKVRTHLVLDDLSTLLTR